MGRSVQVDSLEKKEALINFIINGNIQNEKIKTRKFNFIKTAESYVVVAGVLFYRKGDNLLEVLCREEEEKIKEVLTNIHHPGHRGIFLFFLFF